MRLQMQRDSTYATARSSSSSPAPTTAGSPIAWHGRATSSPPPSRRADGRARTARTCSTRRSWPRSARSPPSTVLASTSTRASPPRSSGWSRDRHGRSPIEVLGNTGLLGPGTVLGHGVHLTDDDIDLIAGSGATVAHCPASNQKLASGFARIPELLAAGVPIALGTDGAASANDLDLWLAMRLAAYPLAARTGVGTVVAADVLAMATTGGAGAAGAPEIGSIEVGTRADLVVLDPSSPSLTPAYDAGRHGRVRGITCRRAVGGRRRAARRRRSAAHHARRRRAIAAVGTSDRGSWPRPGRHDERRRGPCHCSFGEPADGRRRARDRVGGEHQRPVDDDRSVVTAAGVPYSRAVGRASTPSSTCAPAVGGAASARRARSPCTSASCARCPTSPPSSTPTPGTPPRSPSPASICRSSATSAWRRGPSGCS